MANTRGRHGTGTVSRKIFSPQDRVQDFSNPRDSPGFFRFQARSLSGIPQILNLSPGPRPRYPGPTPWDPGEPIPDVDPWLIRCVNQSSSRRYISRYDKHAL